MYVGRLSPGEMGVKRGGRDLVRGRLAWHLRSIHLSLSHRRVRTAASEQTRDYRARALYFYNFFFFGKKSVERFCVRTVLCLEHCLTFWLLFPVLWFEDNGMLIDDNYVLIIALDNDMDVGLNWTD